MVDITQCAKLEVIFPLSCLPELVRLKIRECTELKQIMEQDLEEDKNLSNPLSTQPNLSNPLSTQPHFPKLTKLVVEKCHNLKRVFSTSASIGLSNLKTLKIERCAKLEVIFPLSCLPELERLEIKECKELKQIMEQDLEEDKNLSNPPSTQPHFPKLTKLVVEKCHNLKRIFSTSASIGLSNLQILIISGAAELEELIGCQHGKGHHIENAKIELPKLKLLIFMHLPNLCQGIELLAVKHRIVHNCPKLALTSTTTLQELQENFLNSDFENAQLSRWELYLLIDQINESDEVLTSRDTSELPLLQISEEPEKEFIEEVEESEVQATRTSTNLELNGMSSPNPLDISPRETNIELEWDPMPENTPPLQMNQQDLATSKSEPTCSLLRVRNIVGMVHKQKQIESGALDFKSYKFLALENESNRTPHFQPLEQKLAPISSPKLTELVDQESSSEAGFPDQHALEDTINIEDIRKESIQEVPVSKGPRKKTLTTGVEGISLGGGVATHTKSSGRGILAQGSQVVEIDDKLNESKTVTGTRLEAYKSFVDLDDTQIALLAEAIAAYPHLWNSCQKFSVHFQAWMLKTLADMLLFLRNESASGVTPQREKEFHKLCDEAIELGFDSSWVDEMRQHIVVARDPKLEKDRAQAQINELFKRSTGADMVLDSQVVEQGDGPNEHCIGTSQCQKIQNVDNSIKEASNLLIDKEGEIGVVPNDCIVAPRNEEPKEFELVDRRSVSEPSLMNHQKPLGEISEIRRRQTQTYSAEESESRPKYI